MQLKTNRLWLVLILLLANFSVASAAATPLVSFDHEGVRPGDPALSSRNLEQDELDDLTLVELRLLRAGVFARHGHAFDTAWVRAYFQRQPWYRPRHVVRMETLTALEQANVNAIDATTNKKGLEQLKAIREGIYGHYQSASSMDETDRIEVALTYELQQQYQARDGDERFTLADLRTRSRVSLSILRNGIYVRRGRPFQNAAIRRYFATTEIGYFPNPNYTDRLLTPTDWYNIQLIRKVEDEKGGPLQDVENHYLSARG